MNCFILSCNQMTKMWSYVAGMIVLPPSSHTIHPSVIFARQVYVYNRKKAPFNTDYITLSTIFWASHTTNRCLSNAIHRYFMLKFRSVIKFFLYRRKKKTYPHNFTQKSFEKLQLEMYAIASSLVKKLEDD